MAPLPRTGWSCWKSPDEADEGVRAEFEDRRLDLLPHRVFRLRDLVVDDEVKGAEPAGKDILLVGLARYAVASVDRLDDDVLVGRQLCPVGVDQGADWARSRPPPLPGLPSAGLACDQKQARVGCGVGVVHGHTSGDRVQHGLLPGRPNSGRRAVHALGVPPDRGYGYVGASRVRRADHLFLIGKMRRSDCLWAGARRRSRLREARTARTRPRTATSQARTRPAKTQACPRTKGAEKRTSRTGRTTTIRGIRTWAKRATLRRRRKEAWPHWKRRRKNILRPSHHPREPNNCSSLVQMQRVGHLELQKQLFGDSPGNGRSLIKFQKNGAKQFRLAGAATEAR